MPKSAFVLSNQDQVEKWGFSAACSLGKPIPLSQGNLRFPLTFTCHGMAPKPLSKVPVPSTKLPGLRFVWSLVFSR
jgi:hypothetical protein